MPSFSVVSVVAVASAVAVCAPPWVALAHARFYGVFAVMDHFGNIMLSAVGYADLALHVLGGQRELPMRFLHGCSGLSLLLSQLAAVS